MDAVEEQEVTEKHLHKLLKLLNIIQILLVMAEP